MKYPTPPKSAFLPTIKPSNYPYVYMGEINEAYYEPEVFDRFIGVVKTGSKKTFLHYRTYDWTNENYYVELKSRNNDYVVYKTTMIGYNKVQEWERDTTDRRYFFLFGFLDGLYEWELTQESYDAIGGKKSVRVGGNQGSLPNPPLKEGVVGETLVSLPYTTFNEEKLHLYIPIEKLTKICDKGCLVPDVLIEKSKHSSGIHPCGVCWIKL
jgi:hypothetical protein